MAARVSNFLLGLFVTIGVLLGLAAVLWWGSSRYFQKGAIYAAYFDESVQGLQVDSSVKYRGVDVGRVEKIRVAPDNNLIEVVMKIDLRVEKNTVAQLRAAGITGLVFIELDRKAPDEPDLSPRITFPVEHPVIPSRPSQISQILSGVDAIVERAKEIDFKEISEEVRREFHGISAQFKQTGRALERFLDGPQTRRIMSHLDSVTTRLESTSRKIDLLVQEGQAERVLSNLESSSARMDATLQAVQRLAGEEGLEAVLKEARRALSDSRGLMAGLQEEIQALELAETAGRAGRLVQNLDRRSRLLTREMGAASENLRRASESLERFLEKLEASPSELIFSRPPPPRRKE